MRAKEFAEKHHDLFQRWSDDSALEFAERYSTAENEELQRQFTEANRKLDAMEWKPITPQNLPKVGVPVEAIKGGEIFVVCREYTDSPPGEAWWSSYRDQEINGLTHWRPYNPPPHAKETK